MKFNVFLYIIFWALSTIEMSAQSIKELSDNALNSKTETERLTAAEQLKINLLQSLEDDTFEMPKQKPENFSVLYSDDGFLRIFTWCAPMDQGFYEYFGIIQTLKKTSKIYVLKDDFIDVEGQEFEILDITRWCGAMYSKIITTSDKNKKYYTLFGWDGNDLLSDVKIIDILWFNENSEPFFGQKIFSNCNRCKRILLQYKQNANCMLRYEKQQGFWNHRKINANMIIFNRLVPVNQHFEGNKNLYVPSEIYDAYFWKDGKWIFLEDINAKNN